MPRAKKPATFEMQDVRDWMNEFQGESDRAAAVLAVAFLDVQLEQILRAFAADENVLLTMMEPDHPLGSFGSRRQACLAFGLISPSEAKELSALGKIRNSFAHDLHGRAFDKPPTSDLVLALPRFRGH